MRERKMAGCARKTSSSFFKVYLPHSSSQKMKLPLVYTTRHFNLPDKACLRDRYGNLWPLELFKSGNEWLFQTGWVKFVEDYNLEIGEFLVFHFDGTDLFDVKIVERSGCEKQPGSSKSSVKEEEEEVEDDAGTVRILSIEENHTDDDDEDEDEDDEDYNAEDEEEEEVQVPKKRVSRSKSSKKSKWEANGRAESSHRGKGVRDSYGADIFESGLHPCPKNPYFVTTIRKRRRNELYVPIDVVKHYNLDLPESMTLRDAEGRTYKTVKRHWKDGRVWYFDGLKLLCKWNHLKEGDRCICEFMKEKGRLFLQITFVLAGARGEK